MRPMNAVSKDKSLPRTVTVDKSPYPTVEIVMITSHMQFEIDEKAPDASEQSSGCFLSAKWIKYPQLTMRDKMDIVTALKGSCLFQVLMYRPSWTSMPITFVMSFPA